VQSIVTIVSTNANVTWPAFTPPNKNSILVTATKINANAASTVGLRVTDACGNVTTFDPADVTVNPGRREAVTIDGIYGDENLVKIVNDGLKQIWMTVNGRYDVRITLRPHETRIIDIGRMLVPGNGNTITLEGRGLPGANAVVFVYPGDDKPGRPPRMGHRHWIHEIADPKR
jgi:hypothetical protein